MGRFYGWEASRGEKCSWKGSEFKRATASHTLFYHEASSWQLNFMPAPSTGEEGGLGTLEGLESRESHTAMGLWIPRPTTVCISELNLEALANMSLIPEWFLKLQPMSLVSDLFLHPASSRSLTQNCWKQHSNQWKKSKINLGDHLMQVRQNWPWAGWVPQAPGLRLC